jgi:hypothetical protein
MPDVLDEPGAPPENANATPADSSAAADAALIQEYTQETDIPAPLEKWYRSFDSDRKYVNNDCMALDAQDAVGTNHILRNQYTLMSMLNSRDADIRVNIEDAVWAPEPEMATDPLTGLPQIDPMTGQPAIIGELPGSAPPELVKLARTSEVLAKRLLKESRFRQQLAGAIQDVETNSIMFVKVNQQEDLKKDPLGNLRFNDQQDNYALYASWQAKVLAGDIQPGTAEMARFTALEATVRTYLAATLRQQIVDEPGIPMPAMDPMTGAPVVDPMTGMAQMAPDPREVQAQGIEAGTQPITPNDLPEVASWIGLPIDFVQPEDIRFDWSITRPEDFWRSKRIQHRVYGDKDETVAKYALTPEEAKALSPVGATNNSTTSASGDPSSRDEQLTSKAIGKQVELWECWDRQTNCVYVYAKGLTRFLAKYTPRVVWRMWFPFIPFLFNRVTGRLTGISSTTLQRPAQEEVNLMRTLDRHAKKASFPRILVKRGAFSRGEARKYKNALPYEVIELDMPDEISAAVKETATAPYNPQLTDSSRAEMDLQRMAGVSLVSGGAVGVSNSATETATAQQGTDALADYRRGTIEDLYTDVATCLLDMAHTLFPEPNVKALAGPGAFWPPTNREALWRQLHLTVKAGSTGRPDAEKAQAQLAVLAQMAKNFGLTAKGPEIMDEVAREMGRFEGISRFFQIAPVPMMGPAGASGGPPPSLPGLDSEQGEGGGGGKPMDGAPGPESIPNRPQVG